MRHGKKFNHLGRKPAHRKATLSNMASSLILNKRISTTVAKAKALRKFVEPIITRSKDDTTHSRRMVFKYLQNKDSVKELFSEVADKVANRAGGYTRIIKTDYRLGDNAEMCIMELVDFNELLLEETTPAKSKTRRGRRKKKSGESELQAVTEEATTEVAEAPEAEAATIEEAQVVEETPSDEAQVVEEAPVAEEAPAATENVEAPVEEPKAEAEEETSSEEESGEDKNPEKEK